MPAVLALQCCEQTCHQATLLGLQLELGRKSKLKGILVYTYLTCSVQLHSLQVPDWAEIIIVTEGWTQLGWNSWNHSPRRLSPTHPSALSQQSGNTLRFSHCKNSGFPSHGWSRRHLESLSFHMLCGLTTKVQRRGRLALTKATCQEL